jgi:hypothetical protein
MFKKRKSLLKGGQGTSSPAPSKANQIMYGLEDRASSFINPYSGAIRTGLNATQFMGVGDRVVNPNALSLLHNVNNTVDRFVTGTIGALIPGGSTPIRDRLERKRARRQSSGQDAYDENVEALSRSDERSDRAEGGELDDQMEDLMPEEETHTMPDGTEMEGAAHGEYEEQMESLMDKESPMLPDEEMEEDYVDYVIDETLSNEDRNYLTSALEKDDRLSIIIDQIVESAHEFSGSGPIEGLGTDKSDSIPARLSDGEFVFTAKATEEIGSDNLMSMMKDAEAGAEQRQGVAYGGMVEDEGDPKAVPIQTTGSQEAQGNIPSVIQPNREVDEEMLKASPRRYYVPLSG